MTRALSAAERKAVASIIQAEEAAYEECLARRTRLRTELRDTEREAQRRAVRLTALREVLSGDVQANSPVPRIGPSGRVDAKGSLAGLPRVHAIQIILSESADRDLHRDEIIDQLRSRGFPNEQLGDTSAALAYLKRTGKAHNPARGYWRAA